MEVGDLVKQKELTGDYMSKLIRTSLNMGCIGIITCVHDKINFSYDGRHKGDITVQWSNGKTEILPEMYLEKVKDEE